MLVLSRKLGEQIVLPHCEVTVTVLGVVGKRVRIGVAAPAGTAVHRREIWDKIVGSPLEPTGYAPHHLTSQALDARPDPAEAASA